jgi:Tetratricopeptide repeat
MCEAAGAEHHSKLTSMNNLALALMSQGKYEHAEEMYREELVLSEMVLGKEHPNTGQPEQPGVGAERSGQLRAGRSDASTSTRTKGDSACRKRILTH